jgi:subfamily B ATP-binding cassette protein MsbA
MIENSAELANCADFIKETENSYEQHIGDKGVKVSGGQRQRIAIARELFKEPQILIFDEATSALDTDSENKIQKSILNMIGKRTIVIIAHRLSTMRNCDYIYVLNEGRVAEEGSFNMLYSNNNSLFKQMYRTQNL